ncbi:MAG TPA: hypothetical protein VD886_00625, partial [Herpetosiphonaceae bacterium]|nr:hypothetical protein [Herpetosiphonaceae bacterium]
MTDKAIVAAGTDIAWAGTETQRKLAARVYEAMRLQGSFFPANVPIRQTLGNLAAYVAGQDNADETAVASQIDAALKANSAVFRREEDGETVTYATTRLGYYTEPVIDDKHSFAQRLHEPENPLPIDDLNVIITRTRPALTTVEPVYISDYWQQRSPVGPSSAPATQG